MKRMMFPAIAAALFLAPTLAAAQAPAPQTPPQSEPPAAAAPAQPVPKADAKATVARGELVKVDADGKKSRSRAPTASRPSSPTPMRRRLRAGATARPASPPSRAARWSCSTRRTMASRPRPRSKSRAVPAPRSSVRSSRDGLWGRAWPGPHSVVRRGGDARRQPSLVPRRPCFRGFSTSVQAIQIRDAAWPCSRSVLPGSLVPESGGAPLPAPHPGRHGCRRSSGAPRRRRRCRPAEWASCQDRRRRYR